MASKLLILFTLFSSVFCFTSHPGCCTPAGLPNGPHNSVTTSNGLSITSTATNGYVPGNNYQVTLTATNGINGFVLYAIDQNGNTVGTWTPAAGQLSCLGSTNSLGHSGSQGGVGSIVGSFTAPPAGTGPIQFTAFIAAGGSAVPGTTATAINEVVVQQTTVKTSAVSTSAAKASTVSTSAAKTSAGATSAGATSAGATSAGQATSAKATTAVGQQTSAPVQSNGANQQNLQSGNGGGFPLSTATTAGIAIGVVLGICCIALMIVPIVYARVKKDDPRVQRMTQRFTGQFRK